MSDLRFVIGAVLAIALLGVTAFGLGAAVHLVQQAKLGPLEASRMLAYTPLERTELAQQADGPFARIPSVPTAMPLHPIDSPQLAQAADPAPTADTDTQPALAPASGDADTVDERAVVDPPVPIETEPQLPATAATDSVPVQAPEPAAAVQPTTVATPVPVTETPAEPPGAVDASPVGSIPATAEPADDVQTADLPPVLAAPKARKSAPKTKRVVRKARTKARPIARAIQPTASTGYPVTTDGMVGAPASRARGRNTQNLWSDF